MLTIVSTYDNCKLVAINYFVINDVLMELMYIYLTSSYYMHDISTKIYKYVCNCLIMNAYLQSHFFGQI